MIAGFNAIVNKIKVIRHVSIKGLWAIVYSKYFVLFLLIMDTYTNGFHSMPAINLIHNNFFKSRLKRRKAAT